ncbi:hypothetical protein Tco_1249663 [Tanacetum coccineum]
MILGIISINEDEFCPTKDKKANSDPSSSDGCGHDAGFKSKKKGANKAAKMKHIQGIRFSKPKSNFIYRPVTNMEHMPKPNENTPSCSKEGANGAVNQPSISPTVIMNDSSCSINKNGYFKDDIDLAQLRNNIEKLMDDDKVLDINTNNDMDNVVDTKNLVPNTNVVSTNNKSAHASLKCGKYACRVIPGGGFLHGLEDDLDCYDGYEAKVYDLTEREQAFVVSMISA